MVEDVIRENNEKINSYKRELEALQDFKKSIGSASHAFHADPTIPGTIDEWLDQFEMFSIYEVLPEILKLWGTNLITDAEAKKNLSVRRGS